MSPADGPSLKALLASRDPGFWEALAGATRHAAAFDELLKLSAFRKRAEASGLPRGPARQQTLRLALLGGCSLYPLHELLVQFLDAERTGCELFLGDFDNYVSEIMDDTSGLHAFQPDAIILLPSEQRCRYQGGLTDARAAQQAAGRAIVEHLLELARTAHERTKAEVVLANFPLPGRHDPGPYRARTLGSDWSFRKWVNLELGLAAPPFVHLCDVEFLTNRLGALAARDERSWFESKQPGSPALLVEIARELARCVGALRRAPRKVLALDLDNTLWGGVVAEEGVEGIELGDTSPRGEAFKAFQRAALALKQRGVLLAVCSKNDHDKAIEPFVRHPEMVLRLEDIVSFQANWEPKSDNLRRMAAELELGLDSFVFADDNPAEIEIVRQFAPEVETILLGPDPADYAGQLLDCRFFEPRSITSEDAARTQQYRSESERKALLSSATDMAAYLDSLEMEAEIREFTALDAPRLAQLINKSNQFNLTTRRRTEADLHALMADAAQVCFSMRLRDRFGDHGLISILIGRAESGVMHIDTWLMSCRVLRRQVEDEALHEFARLAAARGCEKLAGLYLPTPKNSMVRDFYATMGFTLLAEDESSRRFELDVGSYRPVPTKIRISRRAYDPS
jgi:FkbH-like protein